MGVSIVAGTLKIPSDYNNLRDQYNTDRFAYENATSANELNRTFDIMKSSFRDADNKKKLSDGITIVTGLFWVYNFWDATRYRPSAILNNRLAKRNTGVKKFYWNYQYNSLGLNILF